MIDYGLIDKYFDTARSAVEAEELLTLREIEKQLLKFKLIFGMNDETLEVLVRRIIDNQTISLGEGQILEKEENPNWFVESRVERGSNRFNAYENYLYYISKYSNNVITGISNTMDKVMNNIGDPLLETSFFKKGLVIGDVQSGKTSNFIGLMNKAADAGYNMIVVTTGTIEKLRRQTQERIEQGFGGFESKNYDINKTIKKWNKEVEAFMVTTKDADFKKNVNFKSAIYKTVPIVAVIKKNKNSLDGLASWLEEHNGKEIDRSLLFIDDEADNATINTKNDEDPTTINRGIRKILTLFRRASYVGFTATPFANVLIDHTINDDLFPSDFILVLDTPSNYMGASKIFSENGIYKSILKSNDDAEESFPLVIPKNERKNIVINSLPESLKVAIRIFFIQNAIRDLRGQKNKHRSMLVNVSHLVDIQLQVNHLIVNEVGYLKRQIKQYILNEKSEINLSLKSIFDAEFSNIEESWEDVYKILYESTDQIISEVINAQNKSFKYEDYPNGARVIAVGGFALSRGLTLEGLSTSYLYRNTLMYDTLMQMGRWFGFRPNYDDIIKLYMPSRSIDWYSQILDATNDLKQQIKNMVNQHKTPEEFGIYIRESDNQDEAKLLITARNKMKNASKMNVTVRISGDYKETTKLEVKQSNYNNALVENWINKYKDEFDNEEMIFKNANKDIVSELLKNYKYGNYNKLNSFVITEVLKDFNYYDVKIIGNQGSTIENINYRTRKFRYEPKLNLIAFSNSRLGSPSDGKYGLVGEAKEKAKNFDKQKLFFSEFTIEERNPLLLIYPIKLNPNNDRETIKFCEEKVGVIFWALSLGVPQISKKPLVYKTQMNTVLQQQLIVGEQMEDFAVMDEDEEDIE